MVIGKRIAYIPKIRPGSGVLRNDADKLHDNENVESNEYGKENPMYWPSKAQRGVARA